MIGSGFGLLTLLFFFFQAEDGIRDTSVTGVQTCAFRSVAIRGLVTGTKHRGFGRCCCVARAVLACVGSSAGSSQAFTCDGLGLIARADLGKKSPHRQECPCHTIVTSAISTLRWPSPPAGRGDSGNRRGYCPP